MIEYSIIGKSKKVNHKGGMRCIFVKNICTLNVEENDKDVSFSCVAKKRTKRMRFKRGLFTKT